jgi:hypothetical protein
MPRARLHPLVTWFCLIWFGLLHSALAAGLVVCRDGSGGASIEWGCERDSAGQCVTNAPADEREPSDNPQPCQDQPIVCDQQLAKAPRVEAQLPAPLPALILLVIPWAPPVALAQPRGPCDGPPRPPDILGAIRTFVLVV